MALRAKSSRVTVASVARRAGVSTTTVSLILSDRQEYLRQFHPDTISKVRDTARRLGYRANLFASGLPTGARSFFGLILRDSGTHMVGTWHQWAFEGELLAGVLQAASELSLYPIVATAPVRQDEQSISPIERIIAGGVMGTIVRSPAVLLEKSLRNQLRHGRPTVVVFPSRLNRWPTNAIDVDNVAVGRTAGELLARQGRRRWCMVHFKRVAQAHALRCEGFHQVAKSLGASVDVIQVPPGFDDRAAAEYLAPRFRPIRPDGVFALNSVSSVASLLACVDLGWKPAKDFHLVGCDCSMWQNTPLPRITAVDVSWNEVGHAAVVKLLELSRAGEHRFPTILLKPRVVPAETCPAAAEPTSPSTVPAR